MFRQIAKLCSTKRGVWITLSIWLILTIILAVTAPGGRDVVSQKEGSGLPEDSLYEQGVKEYDQYFSEDEGTPAFLILTSDNKLTEDDLLSITASTKQLTEENIKNVKEIVPLHQLPPQALTGFISEDGTTLNLPIILQPDLDSGVMGDTLEEVEEVIKGVVTDDISFKMTGPAAIASDTTKLFERADVVLILSTVGLILILLIVIYRSPLLAIIPLLACGIVYVVVDKTLGLAGQAGLFLDAQTLSIMAILLFAAITDYSLFVFARFREELEVRSDKFESMKKAMQSVGEPIFFSGTTVIVAVLMLFFASDAAYRNFAPVFAIAMAIIAIGGLTLVPALFTLFGRIAFWPFVPKKGEQKKKKESIWSKLGTFVVKKPLLIGSIITIVLVAFSFNIMNMQFNYNLLKSFPEDLESREGYELLEEKFSQGSLAPTTVLISADEQLQGDTLSSIIKELEGEEGVESISPTSDEIAQNPATALSENGKAASFQMTFDYNPYSTDAIQAIMEMQGKTDDYLKDNGASDDYSLYFTGETALQADLDRANDRDTLLVIVLVTLFITIMLGLLTRSVIAPLYMMGTILLSYFSALGIGIFLLDQFFGIEDISSRIPLYTFVFLGALGVDYNIMLVSRIQEEVGKFSLKEAVQRGITFTGGVISSAGLILAATFAVLTTQPVMELFTFGFVVALGILIDTFIIRSMLVPAIIVLLGKWAFWPFKKKKIEEAQNKTEYDA